MSRKLRLLALIASASFIFVLWSAYRWGENQRYPDGNIFEHLENVRRSKLPKPAPPEPALAPVPTAAAQLNAAPAFVALRYDAAHVVFIAGADTAPRFGPSFGSVRKLMPSLEPAAAQAGIGELWEPDSESLASLPEIVKSTAKGEHWTLYLSPTSVIPVLIERPVVAATGCSLSAGFLATVPPDQRSAFAASRKDRFVVRRSPAEPAEGPHSPVPVAELPDWKLTPDLEQQIATILNDRMKQELSQIDAYLRASGERPAQVEDLRGTTALGPRVEQRAPRDEALRQGKGKLDYDVRAFRITPDGVPRLFVRARWEAPGEAPFMMTAWLRAEAKPILLFADSSWSAALRKNGGEGPASDGLDFQSVLNVFDEDQDGWGELLVDSRDGNSARIGLYLYTDLGLVKLNASLDRDLHEAESCVDP